MDNNNKKKNVVRLLLLYLIIIAPWVIAVLYYSNEAPKEMIYAGQKQACEHQSSAFHTKFPELNREFKTVHEVTEACLSCHTERGREIMKTAHWNWERESIIPGKGSVYYGKKNAINNYCIGTQSNEQTCTRCHIGYGWDDKNFDFRDPKNIDCLVCHDNTFTYKKEKGAAGYVDLTKNDLSYIAQNVCLPQRENCGKCHFWGGGGNNVKHGDLETALLDCKRDVDVHMATDGADMSCVECHTAENHQMLGRSYVTSSTPENRVQCETCHSSDPHVNNIINKHYQKVACQSCHIPTYAKVNSTKMTWDWSTAGKLDEDGHEIHENDAFGNHTYLSIKGSFTWDRNVVPEYKWFNGTANHYMLGDKIDTIPLQINTLYGEYACNQSKIYPVKVHRGKQPYDTENNYIIQMKTYGTKKGEGAFWQDFDWQASHKAGMEYVGLDYSGSFDFVETELYMPLNHMIAPKEQSVSCYQCHSREGRLAGLTDFYLPGRDYNNWVDLGGQILILLTLIGVIVHGVLRAILCNKNKSHEICM